MALIILEQFSGGVRPGENPGDVAFQLAEHDLPGLEGNPIIIIFGSDAAEKFHKAFGEAMGKPKIEVAGVHQMPGGVPNEGQ